MGTIRAPLLRFLTVLFAAVSDIVAEPQVHEVEVYAFPNKGGDRYVFENGDEVASLQERSISLGSLAVGGGVRVELFEQEWFRGRRVSLQGPLILENVSVSAEEWSETFTPGSIRVKTTEMKDITVMKPTAAVHSVASRQYNASASTIAGRKYLRASNHSEDFFSSDNSTKDADSGKDQEPPSETVAEVYDDTPKNQSAGNITSGNGDLLKSVTGLSDEDEDEEDEDEAEAEWIPPFSTLDTGLLTISDDETIEGMEDVELMSSLASNQTLEAASGENTHNNGTEVKNEEQKDDEHPVEAAQQEDDQGSGVASGDANDDLSGMRDVELMSEIASVIRSGASADSGPKGTINDEDTLILDGMRAQEEEEGGAGDLEDDSEADGSKHVAMIPGGDTRASLGVFRFDGTTAYITPPPPNMDPFFMPGGLITVQELNYETSGIDGEAWGNALRTGTFTLALLGISPASGRSQEVVSTVPSGTFCCPEGLELNTGTAEIKVGGTSLKANADVDSSFESLVLTSDAISGEVTIYGKSHGGAAKVLSHYNSPGGMAFSRLYYLNIGGVGYGGAWYLGFAGTIKSIEFFDNHVDKELALVMLQAYSTF